MNPTDLIGLIVGATLTVAVFSYLVGDNGLFRVAIHLFIGAAAGYLVVIAWYNVLWPQLILPLLAGSESERLFLLPPLVLAALLLARISPRFAAWNPVTAYLAGVGAATAVGGAVMGTFFPQIGAVINAFGTGGGTLFGWLDAGIILIGVVSVLLSFQFSIRRQANTAGGRGLLLEGVAQIGQVFIAITLGAIFAGVYLAALAALVERWQALVRLVFMFL
jgi:hypothetical protein